MDDITDFMNGSDRELVKLAGKVLQKLKREVEETGLKVSIADGDREGQSKAVTFCKFLEERFLRMQQERGCMSVEC